MAPGILTSFRTTAETRAELVVAAERQGITVNRLLNNTVTQSLDPDRDPDKVFGSRASFGLAKLISEAMRAAGERAFLLDGGSSENLSEWPKSSFAFRQAVAAAVAVLEHCAPAGDGQPSQTSTDAGVNELKGRIGEALARDFLAEVASSEEVGSRGERLRRDLDQSVISNIRKIRTGD